MVSGHDLGRAAANKIKQQRDTVVGAVSPFQATVSSFSGGLVYIIEDGVDETPWVQGIRYLNDLRLTVGCRVQIVPTKGGDYLCVGCIDMPDAFAIGETETYEATQSVSDNPSITSTSFVDALSFTVPVTLPAGTYKVVLAANCAMSHSSGGTARVAVACQGVDSVGNGIQMPNVTPATDHIFTSSTFTVAMDGVSSLVTKVRICTVSAGTVTSRNPRLITTVKRTA